MMPISPTPTVSLRPAFPEDERALARLAALDSALAPARPALVAEQDGQLRAAIGLHDGRVIADPFTPTAGLVELLCLHARRMGDDRAVPRAA